MPATMSIGDFPDVSAAGAYVAFESSANLVPATSNIFVDVFVRKRSASATRLITVGPGPAATNADSGAARISADGRYVVLQSSATNLVAGDSNGVQDIFVLPNPP
jgi:Tol biopolymer transport system component